MTGPAREGWSASTCGKRALKYPGKKSHHASHRCRHDLAMTELISRSSFHKSYRLDAKDPGELDTRRVPLSCEELRPIEAESFDTDQDFVIFWLRYRYSFKLENLGSTWLVDDGSFHHGHWVHFCKRKMNQGF